MYPRGLPPHASVLLCFSVASSAFSTLRSCGYLRRPLWMAKRAGLSTHARTHFSSIRDASSSRKGVFLCNPLEKSTSPCLASLSSSGMCPSDWNGRKGPFSSELSNGQNLGSGDLEDYLVHPHPFPEGETEGLPGPSRPAFFSPASRAWLP